MVSPPHLQTPGAVPHGRTQPGLRVEAGLFPTWSSTLWASRQKPRTLAAGAPLISLGTSRRFHQCSSGPHIYLAAIPETSSSWPRAPSSLQPGGAVPTQQGRRRQGSQQRVQEGTPCPTPPGPGPGREAPPGPPRPSAISWLSPRLPGERRLARKVKYSLSIPAGRRPASGPRAPPGGLLPPPPWSESVSGGRALTRWPPQGALCGERERGRETEREREGGFPRPAAAHASCSLSHHQDGSPGRPRRALKPGLGLDPRLPGRPSPCQPATHHVSQAAKLFQPEEQPLDGLLHLLRLKRDNILEISKWFPGRQTPFIFFSFFFKAN